MSDSTRLQVIEDKIQSALKPTHLEVIDDSQQHVGHAGAKSGAGHYTVIVRSDAFNDKNRVQRHQMVYKALKGMIGPEIHALSIDAKTPNE